MARAGPVKREDYGIWARISDVEKTLWIRAPRDVEREEITTAVGDQGDRKQRESRGAHQKGGSELQKNVALSKVFGRQHFNRR